MWPFPCILTSPRYHSFFYFLPIHQISWEIETHCSSHISLSIHKAEQIFLFIDHFWISYLELSPIFLLDFIFSLLLYKSSLYSKKKCSAFSIKCFFASLLFWRFQWMKIKQESQGIDTNVETGEHLHMMRV